MSMNSTGFSGHSSFGAVLPATNPVPVVAPPVMVENNFATLPTPPARAVPTARFTSPYAGKKVNFFRILKSEWLKLWTLRSTWWVVVLTIVLMAGFALLFATVMRTTFNNPDALAAMAAANEAGAKVSAAREWAARRWRTDSPQ